jgi:ADP-ribose pyrophosphatase YjhB (NUDIX family)
MSENLPRVGVATIVVNVGHNVLLGRSTKEQTKGQWIIPGGKIEPFETIQEASTRETLEETGIQVDSQEMLFVSERVNPPIEHRIVVYVSGQAVGGVLRSTFTEEDELSEVRWVDPRDLGFYQHEMSEMTIEAFLKYSYVLRAKAAQQVQQMAQNPPNQGAPN